jgi:hypothetical protein
VRAADAEFITYGGRHTIPLQPVSPFSIDDAIARAGRLCPEPECPTYEVATDAGETINVKVDDIAVEQYPELKAVWEAYKLGCANHEQAVNMELLDTYILEGTLESVVPDPEWVEHRKIRHAESIPDDPDELKCYWMRREVFRRPSDMGEFARMVAELSEMTPEKMKEVEEAFKSKMGQSGRQDDSGAEG